MRRGAYRGLKLRKVRLTTPPTTPTLVPKD
jgi:hypothetical protein